MKSPEEVAAPFDAALASLEEALKHYRATELPWEDREGVTEDIRLAVGQIANQRRIALRSLQMHAFRVLREPERPALVLVPGGVA